MSLGSHGSTISAEERFLLMDWLEHIAAGKTSLQFRPGEAAESFSKWFALAPRTYKSGSSKQIINTHDLESLLDCCKRYRRNLPHNARNLDIPGSTEPRYDRTIAMPYQLSKPLMIALAPGVATTITLCQENSPSRMYPDPSWNASFCARIQSLSLTDTREDRVLPSESNTIRAQYGKGCKPLWDAMGLSLSWELEEYESTTWFYDGKGKYLEPGAANGQSYWFSNTEYRISAVVARHMQSIEDRTTSIHDEILKECVEEEKVARNRYDEALGQYRAARQRLRDIQKPKLVDAIAEFDNLIKPFLKYKGGYRAATYKALKKVLTENPTMRLLAMECTDKTVGSLAKAIHYNLELKEQRAEDRKNEKEAAKESAKGNAD